jgi:hypothetical protein
MLPVGMVVTAAEKAAERRISVNGNGATTAATEVPEHAMPWRLCDPGAALTRLETATLLGPDTDLSEAPNCTGKTAPGICWRHICRLGR